MEEVLAELKYLRRDEPAATPSLAPYELPMAHAVDARGQALPATAGTLTAGPGGAAALAGASASGGGGALPPAERSIYIDHSVSTLHEGAFEGCEGASGTQSDDDGAQGSSSSDADDDANSFISDDNGGAGGGGGDTATPAVCPFGHGAH